MLQSNRQLVIVAGLAGIVLAIVGQALTLGAPMIDEGGAEIQAWLADNRALSLTSTYLLGLGIALMVPLTVALYSRLRAAEGGTGILSGVVLTAGLASLMLVSVAIGTATVAGYRAETISADTAALLIDITWAAVAVAAFPTAISMLAAGRLILQGRALPAYVGYIALIGGVIHLASAAAFDTGGGLNLQVGGAIAAITFYVYAIAAGISLLRQGEEVTAAGLAAAAVLGEVGTIAGATGAAAPAAAGSESARQNN